MSNENENSHNEMSFNIATVKSLAIAGIEQANSEGGGTNDFLISLADMPDKKYANLPADGINRQKYDEFVTERAETLKRLAARSLESSKYFGKEPYPHITAIANTPTETLVDTLRQLDQK